MKLYAYFRSSTSYRVRIALSLKNIKAEVVPVNLLKGEQKFLAYSSINTEMRVPALIEGENTLTQSLAIMEYLEETYPEPPLLPKDRFERARVRALCDVIACDISPLGNLGPLQYLTKKLNITEDEKNWWQDNWLKEGFSTLERMLSLNPKTGKFCHGDTPTMADCCLIPQAFVAKRFKHDLRPYPTIVRIVETCEQMPEFKAAHPSRQPDATE